MWKQILSNILLLANVTPGTWPTLKQNNLFVACGDLREFKSMINRDKPVKKQRDADGQLEECVSEDFPTFEVELFAGTCQRGRLLQVANRRQAGFQRRPLSDLQII